MVQIIKQISQRREAVCGLNGYAKVGGGSPGGGDGDDFVATFHKDLCFVAHCFEEECTGQSE